MWFNENYNSNSMPLPNISERIQMVEKESDLRVKSLARRRERILLV